MQWNYERVHHFRWNARDAVFLFERGPPPPPPPRFPRFISSVRNFISRLSTVEQLVTRDTIQRCTMPRPITMLTTLRARASTTMKLNLPWSIFNGEIFLRNRRGRRKESRVQRFPWKPNERSVALPSFSFRSLFSSTPPFPPCNSLFARLTATDYFFLLARVKFFSFLSFSLRRGEDWILRSFRISFVIELGSFLFLENFFIFFFSFYSLFFDFFFRSCFYADRMTRVSLSLNKKIREYVFFSEIFLIIQL